MKQANSKHTAPATPVSLNQRAEDNLRFIRDTMEGASVFTGVSGLGYAGAGLTALVAAWLAAQQTSDTAWLLVWMLELVIATVLAFSLLVRKTVRQGKSVFSASGRKLLLSFLPTMTIGGLLTLSFFLQGQVSLLPGIWLGLYGAAVMTAGVWSVRVIPVMGALFMLLAACVLFTSLPADLFLAAGFGGLHIVFGVWIWRYHGG